MENRIYFTCCRYRICCWIVVSIHCHDVNSCNKTWQPVDGNCDDSILPSGPWWISILKVSHDKWISLKLKYDFFAVRENFFVRLRQIICHSSWLLMILPAKSPKRHPLLKWKYPKTKFGKMINWCDHNLSKSQRSLWIMVYLQCFSILNCDAYDLM